MEAGKLNSRALQVWCLVGAWSLFPRWHFFGAFSHGGRQKTKETWLIPFSPFTRSLIPQPSQHSYFLKALFFSTAFWGLISKVTLREGLTCSHMVRVLSRLQRQRGHPMFCMDTITSNFFVLHNLAKSCDLQMSVSQHNNGSETVSPWRKQMYRAQIKQRNEQLVNQEV